MSTHNTGFYESSTKSIFQLSSNIHLISSSGFESDVTHNKDFKYSCIKDIIPLNSAVRCIVQNIHQTFEPHHEKTCLWGFRPGPTQTKLYSHRRWLEA